MRHPDCYTRLHNLWRKKYNTPFQWGKHDCLALALEAVVAITGETLSSSHKPLPYNSYKSARRLLGKQSFLNRVEHALKKFERVENYASLQSGDLAVIAMPALRRQVPMIFSAHDKQEENWLALATLDLCASGFVLPRLPIGIARINKRHLTIVKAWRIA